MEFSKRLSGCTVLMSLVGIRLPNFDRTMLLLELYFHRNNIYRRVCANINAEYVLEKQDHGSEIILKAVRKGFEA